MYPVWCICDDVNSGYGLYMSRHTVAKCSCTHFSALVLQQNVFMALFLIDIVLVSSYLPWTLYKMGGANIKLCPFMRLDESNINSVTIAGGWGNVSICLL